MPVIDEMPGSLWLEDKQSAERSLSVCTCVPCPNEVTNVAKDILASVGLGCPVLDLLVKYHASVAFKQYLSGRSRDVTVVFPHTSIG